MCAMDSKLEAGGQNTCRKDGDHALSRSAQHYMIWRLPSLPLPAALSAGGHWVTNCLARHSRSGSRCYGFAGWDSTRHERARSKPPRLPLRRGWTRRGNLWPAPRATQPLQGTSWAAGHRSCVEHVRIKWQPKIANLRRNHEARRGALYSQYTVGLE